MYQIKGWHSDGEEILYVESWEEVLCVISCLEPGMYSAIVVWNGKTQKVVLQCTI